MSKQNNSNSVTTVSLGHLADGASFYIPSLTEVYRDLKLERAGDGGCRVSGKERVGSEDEGYTWKPLVSAQAYMAYSTQVVKGNSPNQKSEKSPKAPYQPMSGGDSNGVVGKRGRKAKNINFVWPAKEFTLAQVIEATKCEKHDLMNFLYKNKGFLVEVGAITGGRGKPRKIFKLANAQG